MSKKKNSSKKDDTQELFKKINNDNTTSKNKKINRHFIVHSFLFIVLLGSLTSFVFCLLFSSNNANFLERFIESLILVLFTLLFVGISITSNKKRKGTIFISSLLLLSYFVFNILNITGVISLKGFRQVENFSGRSLTDVISWADANNVRIEQEYEYSDMVDEYMVISQNIKAGTKVKDIDSITISISEGPNPSKEIVIPNMVSWDVERVTKFVDNNHLSNVDVSFIASDKAQDTVIEQSKTGNLKRDEELKLTFSYGEELGYSEVKLIDFTKKSKFEVQLYMKQHQLKYEFKEKFSSNIKNGYVVSQSIKANSNVKINDETITIYLSKGPKIKVPDLKEMSITEITNWVIKNRLKLEISDRYDDSIKNNKVIEVNYSKGDIIKTNTIIKVIISKGKLKMPKFNSFEEFREWADKYSITYEEKYEFSDDVAAGEVISYSYKTGEVIKNNDSIIVTISDGKKLSVPDLKGLTKSEAISKLKKVGLNYNFVYKNSSSVSKDKVISQSISAGSEVSKNTTITITLSSGKTTSKREDSSSSSSNNSSNNAGSGSSSNTGSSTPTPSCDTSKGAYFFLGAGNTGSQVYESTKTQNPGFTISATYVDSCSNGATTSGMVCNSSSYDEKWISYCTTIKLTIVK